MVYTSISNLKKYMARPVVRKAQRARIARRSYARGLKRMKGMLGNPNKSYFYKYKISRGTVGIGSAQSTSYNSINFTLNDITNVAELTSLYDEYQITKVVVDFIPRAGALSSSPSGAAGNVNQQFSTYQPFLTVVDYDDNTPPSSRDDMLEYGTCKVSKPNTMVRRVIVPKIQVQTYISANSVGKSAKSRQWLDCVHPDIPHFGLKWAWNQSAAAGADTVLYDIYCTYYVKFRGCR